MFIYGSGTLFSLFRAAPELYLQSGEAYGALTLQCALLLCREPEEGGQDPRLRVSGIRCLLLIRVEPEEGGQDPRLRVSGIRCLLLILVEPEEGGQDPRLGVSSIRGMLLILVEPEERGQDPRLRSIRYLCLCLLQTLVEPAEGHDS